MSDYSNFTFFTILFVAAWIILNAVCQVSVKAGIMQLKDVSEPTNMFDKDNIANILSNKFIVGGFALYLISTIFWFGALSKLDISLLSPLGSMIFVMVAILAMVFLGEKVSPLRWTGIFVTIVGVVLLANS
jgi:drug/metabolite transporter (DMT)-like permease